MAISNRDCSHRGGYFLFKRMIRSIIVIVNPAIPIPIATRQNVNNSRYPTILKMNNYKNRVLFNEYKSIEIVYGECSHSFPTHVHEHFCAGFITGGYAAFTINNHKRLLLAGDCYVIPPYTPHALSSVNGNRFTYSAVCFKESHADSKLSCIVTDAKTYIESTTSKFNIDLLSKTVHISKYHLDRLFKRQVGITPYQFYIGDRVKKIRQGLQAHISLSDLVYNLNFSDQSHLCNTFKKHMGITPIQYMSSYHLE